MSIARTLGVALTGLTGQIVEVQADLSAGLPGLTFTGLPDTSVVEARDRIRAAVLNSGSAWPNRRITLALLPADVRKAGSRFDLAIVGVCHTSVVRATIYARISRDREGAGLGVQSQEFDCRELADRLGWTIVSTHTDN